MQKDKPIAQAHVAEARVRLRALRGLLADTVGEIEMIVAAGGHVVFDYDTSRELAAALTPGMKVPRTAMV
jgi:3-hydroxy-9,10-secoandrosta-1,3,5(10)-triene-9,17-dione monooxygenase